MATTARLSGDGVLIAPGLNLPVAYTLVLTLGGRRRAASGVIDAPEAMLGQALSARSPRLRLEDGAELSVALRQKIPTGPVLIQSVGSLRRLPSA